MNQKKKTYKEYAGEISESVKVARWGAPLQNQEESSYNIFMNYANGNGSQQTENVTNIRKIESRKISQEESRKQQESVMVQGVGIESGFRKFKNNQVLTLKELKQEYQILRNLPIDDRKPLSAKDPDSVNSSIRDDNNSVASSKHSQNQRRDHSRQVQLLALEKKQLQIVIGNSMKKVEELLHHEMEYKKQIHDLKLQMDGKGEEEKYQNTIRALKKNQAQSYDIIESLKRQIQRLKGTNKQLVDNIGRLEGQLLSKTQQLRKSSDQRRKYDDLIRFEKDKHSNLQIQMRKIKMESELLEKEKNSQLNRLMRQFEQKDTNFEKDMNLKIRRLEEQVQTKDKRYQLLLDQFEQIKKKQEKFEKQQIKPVDQVQDLKKMLMEALAENREDRGLKDLLLKIDELKQQNRQLRNELRSVQVDPNEDVKKSQMFLQTINEIFNKMDQKGRNSGDSLKRQIQEMKNHISQISQSPDNIHKIRQQDQIIKQMQKIIDGQNGIKMKFKEEILNLRNQYNAIAEEKQNSKIQLTQLFEKQIQYKQEITSLKRQIQMLKTNQIDLSSSQIQFKNMCVKVISLQRLEKETIRLQEQVETYKEALRRCEDQKDTQVRNLKRKVDQLTLQTDKLKKQSNLELQHQKMLHVSQIQRIKIDYQQLRNQRDNIRSQLQKAKSFYQNRLGERARQIYELKRINEQKINVKAAEIESLKVQYEEKSHTRVYEVEGVKKNLQTQITVIKQKHQEELSKVLKRLEMLTDANQKFRIQSERYLQIERQVLQLRKLIKQSKSLNDSVGHLWQIKETEYGNVNQILRLMKAQ